MDEIFVGIDLGTTNTLACVMKKGKPDFIRFPGSQKLLPSVIYVDENKEISVGKLAAKKGSLDPRNMIRSSKTYMGDFEKNWKCNGITFTPTQAATEILKEVKENIIKKLKCDPDTVINAVITVPAYFNSNQTDETKKAGINAGFNVQQIITEPMAAAIAAVRDLKVDQKLMVIDLGGGTFDLSVLEADHSNNIYKALCIDGDRKLGGDDFDEALQKRFVTFIEDDLGINLANQKVSGLAYGEYYSMLGQIHDAAEKAKIALSDENVTEVTLPNLFNYDGKSYNFEYTLTRKEFDSICKDIYTSIFERIRKFIATNKKLFKVEELAAVILAGGSCYIPHIREEVERIFKRDTNSELDISTLVVLGAFYVANSGLGIQDIISHSLGVAAMEAQKGRKQVLSKILLKGDVFPCEKFKIYTTTRDNQTEIPIFIYEAGSDKEDIPAIDEHDFYGNLVLEGIDPAPKGTPSIKVTFSYDKSRCLTVTAVDEKTGKEKNVIIQKGEKAQIESMRKSLDILLLMDTSNSMSWRGALAQEKDACKSLVEEMIDFSQNSVGLIKFGSTAILLYPLGKDVASMVSIIDSIKTSGGTNMIHALGTAETELRNSKNERIIIMVTDGAPWYDSLGDYEAEKKTLDYAGRIKKSGIRLITIGAGDSVKYEFLKKLSSPGDAYKIENMNVLKETFKEVIDKITEK